MKKFFQLLKNSGTGSVFNPWYQYNPETDRLKSAPDVRRRMLRQYLEERRGAKYILVAEALGFQGGRFTGIPMTSERMLLGKVTGKGITPNHVIDECDFRRTSQVHLRKDGFTEPTASIVWGQLINSGWDTRDFVFWNAFPWHPYQADKGQLSNRMPNAAELEQGREVLFAMVDYFDFKHVIAVGRKSESLLDDMAIENAHVRHPARGGATAFRNGLQSIIEDHNNITMEQAVPVQDKL